MGGTEAAVWRLGQARSLAMRDCLFVCPHGAAAGSHVETISLTYGKVARKYDVTDRGALRQTLSSLHSEHIAEPL